jgi:hypothetical protein
MSDTPDPKSPEARPPDETPTGSPGPEELVDEAASASAGEAEDPFLEEAPRRWPWQWRWPRRWFGGTGWRWRVWRVVGALVLAALLLYYPIGMLIVHRIDDDPSFETGPVEDGASHAVAIAAALIDREVDQHAWPANDPFFLPGAALDNMPNFQIGIIQALARFAVEMTDQIGRTRGSSQADPDLEKAAGLLKYAPDVWIFDPSTSWAPTASSESQYRAARRALLAYNVKLADHQAVFERRADNLLATLDRFAADIGSVSAIIDQRIHDHAGDFVDFQADNVFYNAKGKLYAYALLFRELGVDFAKVIAERDLEDAWKQTEQSLMQAGTLSPLIVINGQPDGLFMPNHLAAEGFYLMRARTQLREITAILAK